MSKSLYLECGSGISGDMTVAALLDLGADREVLEKSLESLKLPGYEIAITSGEAKEPVYFQLTGTEDERSFVCIEKGKATPKKYPRKAGTPAKEPIQ